MRTCTVQMPTNGRSSRSIKQAWPRESDKDDGFVLLEMILVIAILGLMTTIVGLKMLPAFERSRFTREANDIVNALKTAQNAAAQSGRRYAVMFDLIEQNYILQEINAIQDLAIDAEPDPAMVLTKNTLTKRCYIDYIRFDDGQDTRDEGEELEALKSYFVAGRSGWQNGGKIVMLDIDGNPYTVVVNRLSKMITLVEGELDIFGLEAVKDLPF